MLVGGHSGCQIQLFFDRGGNGGRGNWLDRRILVALVWSPTVSPLYERRRERAKREGWGC